MVIAKGVSPGLHLAKTCLVHDGKDASVPLLEGGGQDKTSSRANRCPTMVVLSHRCPRSYRHPPLCPAFGRQDMT